MRGALRAGTGAAILAVIAALPGTAGAAGSAGSCVATPAPAEESAMTAMIAAQRRTEAVPRLKGNAKILKAGRSKSLNMAKGGRFAHSGSLPWAKGRAAGQNIAMAPDAGTAFNAMLGSPGHHANIVSTSFRFVAVGAARSCGGQVFFTLNFLGPAPR